VGGSVNRSRPNHPWKYHPPVGEIEHPNDKKCGTRIPGFQILAFFPIANQSIESDLHIINFQQIWKGVRTNSPTRYLNFLAAPILRLGLFVAVYQALLNPGLLTDINELRNHLVSNISKMNFN
jgi:hypothetical protein